MTHNQDCEYDLWYACVRFIIVCKGVNKLNIQTFYTGIYCFRFSLSDPNIPDQEKAANDTDRLVTFNGLVPGRLYNITVWTVSKNVASQPLQRQDRLCKYMIYLIIYLYLQIVVEIHSVVNKLFFHAFFYYISLSLSLSN